MPNPDAKNLDSGLANSPPRFKRSKPAATPPIVEKTKAWAGLPGKTGPDRSAGIKKVKVYPKAEGI